MTLKYDLKHLSLYIAIITFFSGAFQMCFPVFMLSIIGTGNTHIENMLSTEGASSASHFFRIVGMFMLLFGGMLWQSITCNQGTKIIAFWSTLQKFGAVVAVCYGTYLAYFSWLALTVAAFDALSTVILCLYYRQLKH